MKELKKELSHLLSIVQELEFIVVRREKGIQTKVFKIVAIDIALMKYGESMHALICNRATIFKAGSAEFASFTPIDIYIKVRLENGKKSFAEKHVYIDHVYYNIDRNYHHK